MGLTNPIRNVAQNMVNVQTHKHISQKRMSGTAVRCFQEALFQIPRTETVLQCSRFCYKLEETKFSLFHKISANAIVELGIRQSFSEPFETVALGLLSYLVVRTLNQMIIFLSDFPCPSSFSYGFEEQLFEIFRKVQ